MAEAVTVTAESPLVDVTQTAIGINITAGQFGSLPAARSFQQLTTLGPSVTLEMGDHDNRFQTSPTLARAVPGAGQHHVQAEPAWPHSIN